MNWKKNHILFKNNSYLPLFYLFINEIYFHSRYLALCIEQSKLNSHLISIYFQYL